MMAVMQRGWRIAALAISAVLILIIVVLVQGWRPHESPARTSDQFEQAELTQISPDGRADDGAIERTDLGRKYLSIDELDLLGVEIDPTQVKHRTDYELGQWGVGCRRGLDCIVAINQPSYESVDSADEWLRGKHFVLSVRFADDDVRAYPLNLISFHEIVNDTVNGTPVAVTYCPLCHSGVAFERPLLDDEPLEFRVSGRLYNANLLMVDRQTGSFWNQIAGHVVAGPLLGRAGTMHRIPTDLVFWEDWREAHPNGRVLSRPEEVVGLREDRSIPADQYLSSPYAEYMMRPGVGFGVDTREMSLNDVAAKRLVFGVEVDGVAKAYLDGTLEDAGWVHDTIGGTPVLAFRAPSGEVRVLRRTHPDYEDGTAALTFARHASGWRDEQTGTIWSAKGRPVQGELAEQGKTLAEIEVLSSYWFAWLLFHPDTQVYRGSE